MVSSYEAAGWVGFALFAVIGVIGGIVLRINAKHQTTHLKLLLYLIIAGSSLPFYGFEALPGFGGNNVVAGHTVNWARYVINAIRIPFFAALVALSLDPNPGKAFVEFWIGVGASLPLVFACQSSNDGVWFFWIFSVLSGVVYALYTFFFLQVPADRLTFVSNNKAWFVKGMAVLAVWVYVLVGYLIDTPFKHPTNDLALLQWLNIGWDTIVLLLFGIYVLGWVDLFEGSNTLEGMHMGAGSGGMPFMAPVHVSPCAAPPGYQPVPQAPPTQGAQNHMGAVPGTGFIALHMPKN